ncbi:MAG: outer membrane protein [Gammaproteobacteria bacterium]|jgi:outer membrane protein
MMKSRLISFIWLLAVNGIVLANEPLPKLELGAGFFALNTPDYRGSSEGKTYLIVTPYVKYRGDKLRVDEGAQGILIDSNNLLLTISGNLSFPADDETPEREGMDTLNATLEIGPSLNVILLPMQNSDLWLDLPVRFAFRLNSSFDDIGAVFQPRLSWRKPSKYLGDWKLRFNIGPFYATNQYHDYYYSVNSIDATADRPQFETDGGFSGIRSEFTWSKRFKKFWIGGFVRYDSLASSTIDDSPLVSEENAWMGGAAIAWVFHQEN